jgi:hypothetical protein
MSTPAPIRVLDLGEDKVNETTKEKPAHWVDEKPSAFQNPWPSWHAHSASDFLLVRSPKDIGICRSTYLFLCRSQRR